MNILLGIVILIITAGVCLRYRPRQKQSLLILLLCALTGVVSLVSAMPSGLGVAVATYGLQLFILSCGVLSARREFVRRQRRAARLAAKVRVPHSIADTAKDRQIARQGRLMITVQDGETAPGAAPAAG